MIKPTSLPYFIIAISLFLSTCQSSKSFQKQPLSLIPLFGNQMVLQQKRDVAFWGTYTPMEAVTITGSWGEEMTAIANEKGDWQLNLPTPAAGGPFDVTITTKDTSINYQDVLIGEIWLASGQSNMEMPLKGFPPNEPIDDASNEIANANYPQIRYFDVPHTISQEPVSNCIGKWKITSPQTAPDFSAAAYFFARKLHKSLNIPIGIITSNWGGTPVESWISREKIRAMGEFEETLTAIEAFDRNSAEQFLSQFQTVDIPVEAEAINTLNLQDEKFIQPDFNDATWTMVKLPGVFEDFNSTTGNDGAFWFRKKIAINDINSDYNLLISKGIDDMDIIYVNGQKVGSMVCYNCPRSYTVSKSILKKGENTIAIRAIDTGGPGSLQGDFYLKNDTGQTISLAGEWAFMHTAAITSVNGQRKMLLYHLNPLAANNPPEGFAAYNMFDTPHVPGVLYNGMIHPIIPYSMKGAIWYQGESNVGRAEQYEKIFPGMIEDWRAKWKNDFPFYFVQIAPFNYNNELSPHLRDAQRKSLKTPKTGMAVTMDIGNAKSIHPGNKQDVGDRLARLALANDYGKAIITAGPLYKGLTISKNKLLLEFDNIGGGLLIKDEGGFGFEIAGANKAFVPARANIIGDRIEVFTPRILRPQYVRYGWKDFTVGTLFNMEGLPASSFMGKGN